MRKFYFCIHWILIYKKGDIFWRIRRESMVIDIGNAVKFLSFFTYNTSEIVKKRKERAILNRGRVLR